MIGSLKLPATDKKQTRTKTKAQSRPRIVRFSSFIHPPHPLRPRRSAFHMMKRKADDSIDGAEGEGSRKRAAIDSHDLDKQDNFRQSIFGQELDELKKRYSESTPFVFPVLHSCISILNLPLQI